MYFSPERAKIGQGFDPPRSTFQMLISLMLDAHMSNVRESLQYKFLRKNCDIISGTLIRKWRKIVKKFRPTNGQPSCWALPHIIIYAYLGGKYDMLPVNHKTRTVYFDKQI